MRRSVKWLIPLLVIGFGLLWPAIFQGSAESSGPVVYDPVVITDYDVNVVVGDDGGMRAVETITTEFPGGRHGIFRYWDVANQNNPNVRQTPVITSVLLDGKPAPYQLSWEDGERFRVAKIGDPDRTLRFGTHVFEISYTIPGVLDPGDIGAEKGSRSLSVPAQRLRSSSGTSSRRPGTTASTGPTSPSPSPGRSAPPSARSGTESAAPAKT